MSTKIPIHFADESLETINIMCSHHDDEQKLSTSGAVNLAIQLTRMIASEKINLKTDELLYCCDVMNPGASLTEFETPDSVSIRAALESMKFNLLNCLNSDLTEKWAIDAESFVKRLNAMTDYELFAIAFATRVFWSDKPFKNFKRLSECKNYSEWGKQWIA